MLRIMSQEDGQAQVGAGYWDAVVDELESHNLIERDARLGSIHATGAPGRIDVDLGRREWGGPYRRHAGMGGTRTRRTRGLTPGLRDWTGALTAASW